MQNGYLQAFKKDLFQIPVPAAPQDLQEVVIKLVQYILYLNQQSSSSITNKPMTSAQDNLMLKYFEQIINGLVYELYFPEDLHAHDFAFADPLQSENLPALDDIQDNKLEALRAIFQRLYAQDHPIRRNLFLLDTVPVIRIIEGKG